ncbi:MAG: DUF5606 domain-containing protein [Prolixibacteraceae bacterium]|nr:DUF5606 domain-containing protein [Prolixibacteraceae bacterium]
MLKGLLTISGQPGLYRMIAESKDNIIVESLITGKRMPAYSSSRISSLEDIAIYTDSGEVPLKDVLKLIYDLESGKNTISHKSSGSELKSYFAKVLPAYDRERVYISDIKKVLFWYNILLDNNLLQFSDEGGEEKIST